MSNLDMAKHLPIVKADRNVAQLIPSEQPDTHSDRSIRNEIVFYGKSNDIGVTLTSTPIPLDRYPHPPMPILGFANQGVHPAISRN